jgi:hypothetical protein
LLGIPKNLITTLLDFSSIKQTQSRSSDEK